MPSSKPSAPNEAVIAKLLSQADWVRGLARTLVADPGSAEDLAQDALVAAVEAPPARLDDARAWLGAVLRNLVRRRSRSEQRRTERETFAARSETVPSTAKLVERASLQSDLVARVVSLDPLYREVLLLHFFEGLPTARIAKRLDMPENTVRTRIGRGLGLLREKLDSEYGDRSAWSLMLAPLLAMPLGSPLGSPFWPTAKAAGPYASEGAASHGFSTVVKAGILLMQFKLLISSVAAIVIAVLAWPLLFPSANDQLAVSLSNRNDSDLGISEPTAPSFEKGEQSPGDNSSDVAGNRNLIATPPAPALAPGVTHSGVILDEWGAPLANLPVVFCGFEYERVKERATWARNALQSPSEQSKEDARWLQQFQSDPNTALASVGLSEGESQWFRFLLEASDDWTQTTSDKSGRFELVLPPGSPTSPEQNGPGIPLRLGPGNYVQVDIGTTTDKSGLHPETVLIAAPSVAIAGKVVSDLGEALPNVAISQYLGIEYLQHFPIPFRSLGSPWSPRSSSKSDGLFDLPKVADVEGSPISFELPGYKAAAIPIPRSGDLALTVVLTARALRLNVSGIILSAEGAPLEKAQVTLGHSSTHSDSLGRFTVANDSILDSSMSLIATLPGHLPGALSGMELIDSDLDQLVVHLGPPPLQISGTLVLAGEADPRDWLVELIDASEVGAYMDSLEKRSSLRKLSDGRSADNKVLEDGSFSLGGLSNRSYQLLFWNQFTGQSHRVGPTPAGTKGLVVAPVRLEKLHTIQGHVASLDGTPMADVTVYANRILPKEMASRSRVQLLSAKTDTEGAFIMSDLGTKELALVVGGTDLRVRVWEPVPDTFFSGDALLEVERLCRFHIQVSEDDRADSFSIFDSAGERLLVISAMPGSSTMFKAVPKVNGRFQTCEVGESAAEVVLYRDKVELRRIPIVLTPGALQEFEL